MRDLADSLGSFTWAMTVFGAQQASRLLAAPWSGARDDGVAGGFEAVAWEAQQQLDNGLGGLFEIGDSLERDAVDLTFDLLPADPFDPGQWLSTGGRLLAGSMASLRLYTPTAEGFPAWRELANKLEVYRLVREVSQRIGVPPAGGPFPLGELVDRSYALGPFPALWAVEGLGHDFAFHAWQEDERPPRGLLTGGEARELPAKSFLMLHAGLGLAFAQRRLAEVPPHGPDEPVRLAVSQVLELCRSNSRPGDVGAAFESLGLVTRTFHPARVAAVDRTLRREEPDVVGYFWHGVGRALYFLPINFLPWGEVTWRPFAMARREAPDDEAWRNLLAGLGWAFTLVNMRQPELPAHLLLADHGRELAAGDAFANGVASSLMMRQDTTPDAPLIRRFLGFQPREPRLAALWEALVRKPATRALAQDYPRLREAGRLGEIFRYRPLAGTGKGSRS